MNSLVRLAEEVACRTTGLLRRIGTNFAIRYGTKGDEVRGVASTAIKADHDGASRITWGRVVRIAGPAAGIGLWANLLLVGDSTEGQLPESYEGPVEEVEALLGMSPTLVKTLRELEADKWIIRWGPSVGISYTDRDKRLIIIDSGAKGNMYATLATLAHEIGHAYKGAAVPPRPAVALLQRGMTREQWIDKMMELSLVDEAEALLMRAQVQREIVANGGPNILEGARAKYEDALDDAYYEYSIGRISRQEARLRIADNLNDPEGFWYKYYYPKIQNLSEFYFSSGD